MDIESAEWDVLKDLPDEDMKRYKYISFELHLGKKAPNITILMLLKNYQNFIKLFLLDSMIGDI